MTTLTPDTSVVVAALSAWHPDHEMARGTLKPHPPVVGHVLMESYSVLTRLPGPRRLAPDLVLAALFAAFPADPVTLQPLSLRPLLERVAGHGIVGGSTYDAVVAETARRHGLTLVTLDRRARSTYDAVGVDTAFLA